MFASFSVILITFTWAACWHLSFELPDRAGAVERSVIFPSSPAAISKRKYPHFRYPKACAGSVATSSKRGGVGRQSLRAPARCVSIEDCPEALKSLTSVRPEICGWEGGDYRYPLVCCRVDDDDSAQRRDVHEVCGCVGSVTNGRCEAGDDDDHVSERKSATPVPKFVRKRDEEAASSSSSSSSSGSGPSRDAAAVGARSRIGTDLTATASGRNGPHKFIVGGEAVDSPGDFPWMAALGERQKNKTEWFCGGTLISDIHVLTAAHCLTGRRLDVVRLGELDLANDREETRPMDFLVSETLTHENYAPPVLYHDLAIIRLDRVVPFSRFIRPACLPEKQGIALAPVLTVTGWGMTSYGGATSNILQTVDVPVIGNDECNAHYAKLGPALRRRYPDGITADIVCAGTGGKDSCGGDSGGPLLQRSPDSERYSVVGVVSAGLGCGTVGFPAFYARVDKYVGWISQILASK